MDKMWSDVFDRVVMIRYTDYADRDAALLPELERVGLADIDVRWTFPSPFTVRLGNSLRFREGLSNLDETINGMYRELKVSLELGVSRLLVLEDDIRFLKDLDMLAGSLRAIPDDFIDAKFSWIRRGGETTASMLRERAAREGRLWVPTTGVSTRDTGAIAYSRRGMEWMVQCYESSLELGGPVLRSCDLYDRPPFYLDGGRHNYLAVPLCARQVQYTGHRMSRINLDRYYDHESCQVPGGRHAYGD